MAAFPFGNHTVNSTNFCFEFQPRTLSFQAHPRPFTPTVVALPTHTRSAFCQLSPSLQRNYTQLDSLGEAERSSMELTSSAVGSRR